MLPGSSGDAAVATSTSLAPATLTSALASVLGVDPSAISVRGEAWGGGAEVEGAAAADKKKVRFSGIWIPAHPYFAAEAQSQRYFART